MMVTERVVNKEVKQMKSHRLENVLWVLALGPVTKLSSFFHFIGLIYPFVISVPCKMIHHAQDDILKFFEVTDGNDVTWLHAVNSPELLEQGLSGKTMMLEADVLMRNNMVD